jgi:SPP1 family predicted phage head-tail adaptor
MKAGMLRHSITIETATETLAASGETTQTWTTFASVRAAIQPANGKETWRAAQVNPTLTHAITIRYLPRVTTKMRIKYIDEITEATRYFGIESIIDTDEKHVELHLMCSEDLDG